jgi:hypothetical protein
MNPWFYTAGDLVLPPGKSRFVHDAGGSAPVETPQLIMGVRAHMHKLGSEMYINREGEDGSDCLVRIERYDFDWQRSYFLKEPVPLLPGDKLDVRCVYDTTSADGTVTWGEGTEDEMCLATFYTTDM